MLIESILRRPGGTRVKLGGVEYHFKPDAEGREICDVRDPEHAQRLLSIREGYRPAEPVSQSLPGLSAPTEPETIQPEGDQETPGINPEPEIKADSNDRDYWAAQFEQRFGRKPHGRWGIDRIRSELES